MKKFLSNILKFLLLINFCTITIYVFGRYVIGPQYTQGYQASLIDKVKRLKSIDDPKIILVGDSNVAFGICSELIEADMRMPVVNLGLHGALNNAFHEEIAKLNIQKGDIVVVCHTSYSDDDKINDLQLAWITYDYHDEIWPVIRNKDYPDMLRAYPTYFKDAFYLWLTHTGNTDNGNPYSRNAFNKYGDVVQRPASSQADPDLFFQTHPDVMPSVNELCMKRLNKLNQYCIDRGASMVVAGYPINYGKYSTYTKEDFREFQKKLEDSLDCDVISDFTDYFYPYSYFYDTLYHMNEEGARARTLQLISDLKRWKDEKSESGADE